MNRLKYILTVIIAAYTVLSCKEFNSPDMGSGYLSVSLDNDDRLLSKVSEAEDMIFSLDIYKDENLVGHVDDCASLEAEPLNLLSDTYTVKAYSDTEADAAWDTPFYSGETQVRIYPDIVNEATVTCTVNNVVVSAEFDETFTANVKEYSLVVSNGRASMTFSEAEGSLDKKAYFSVTGTLEWTLTFTNPDGKVFTAGKSYTDLAARQHYKLQFSVADPEQITTGAAGIKIIVDDSINEAEEFEACVYPGLTQYPNILANEEFDISAPVSFPEGNETPKILTAYAKYGIASYVIRQLGTQTGLTDYSMLHELVEADDMEIEKMKNEGIKAASVMYGAANATVDITEYVSRLKMGQHFLEAAVYDVRGHKTEKLIILDVQSNVDAEAFSVQAGARTALLTAMWYGTPAPEGLGLEYRLAGASEWTDVPASDISFDESRRIFSTTIEGLSPLTPYEFRPYSANQKELDRKSFTTNNVAEAASAVPWGRFSIVRGKWYLPDIQPDIFFEYREYGTTGWIRAEEYNIDYDSESGTFVGDLCGLEPNITYECRVNAEGAIEEKLNLLTFTTGNAGTVYNMNFDEWYQSGKVWYPFAEGGSHTWDSANEGAANYIGSSTTPVEGSDAVSGKAAKMVSDYAVIAFAAGNLYTGDFGKVAGVGAELEWGVPFESKPVALRGYYKYSPVAIDNVGDGIVIDNGQMDKMQIQICLTDWTAPFKVNTSNKKFVDFNEDYVIAYGKLESDQQFSTYQEFMIPLEYREKNKGKTPTYIVISACASYLGDYFTGGKGSTLYVDEFSFEYNPSKLTKEQRDKVNYR